MDIRTPTLDQVIDIYILCCATEGKSPKTIDWYSANLRRFRDFLKQEGLARGITDIGTSEARKFIFHLQNNVKRWETSPYVNDSRGLSSFSVHGYARTIKAFWSWLLAEGYISHNPMVKLRLPRTEHKVIATFSPEQVKKLLDATDRKTPAGFRDYVMIMLLYDTGIRLSEIINLDFHKIDFSQSCLVVNGKGNRERTVPFGREVRRMLWRYMSGFRPEPDSPQVVQLFLTDKGLPLRPRAVQSMLSRLGKRAGISEVRCSPHTLRHTFAKQYLMCGGDVFSLQRILGHSSLEVVKIYINLLSSEICKQHSKFSPADNMEMAGLSYGKRLALPAATKTNRSELS
ncbi:tyrosine-type recombinase/integrase [Chloroflexota bacterium]